MIPWTTYDINKMKTSDNANIYFYEQKPLNIEKGILIIIPGWACIAETWSPVLLTNDYLKKYYHVFIILTRGYNNEYYDYGNTLDRYAMDIYEFIKFKHLKKNISLLGHSIGGAIIWKIISLFGEKMFKNFIIVDEPPVILKNKLNASISNNNIQKGMVYTEKMLYQSYKNLNSTTNKINKFKTKFVNSLFTPNFKKKNPEILDKIIKGASKFNNKVLADILVDDVNINNIKLILHSKIISKPILIIGGELSIINYKSIEEQKKYYKHPTIYIFKGEGSSHLMFIENYNTFNKVLNSFLRNKNKTLKLRQNIKNKTLKTKH
jgi:pimeloyl-ACP methyl ester carboxylesterase